MICLIFNGRPALSTPPHGGDGGGFLELSGGGVLGCHLRVR